MTLDSSSQKNWPGGQQDQGPEVVLHVQEEVYQPTLTLKSRVAGTKNDSHDSFNKKCWIVSLSHPSSVLTRTYSRTKYQSLGLTLLNARSSLELLPHRNKNYRILVPFSLHGDCRKSHRNNWKASKKTTMITMMTSVNLQESDRGVCGDDALWQLLRGPGAHGKLHQQHRHLLRREYLHKVHRT